MCDYVTEDRTRVHWEGLQSPRTASEGPEVRAVVTAPQFVENTHLSFEPSFNGCLCGGAAGGGAVGTGADPQLHL